MAETVLEKMADASPVHSIRDLTQAMDMQGHAVQSHVAAANTSLTLVGVLTVLTTPDL